MTREVLRMEQIVAYDRGVKKLDHLSLNVFEGEILGVLGHSGAGKTSIAQVLSGRLPFTQGRLYVNEARYEAFSMDLSRRSGVFCIHYQPSLAPQLTIAENIFVLKNSPFRAPLIRTRLINHETVQLLALVGLSCYSPATLAQELSAAEQILVLLAKAIASSAVLVVLDAVMDTLFPMERHRVLHVLEQLKPLGLSFLVADRTPRDLIRFADRITVLRDGHGVKTFYRGEYEQSAILHLLTGRAVSDQYVRTGAPTKTVALQVDQLRLPQRQAVSFQLHQGEILSILDVENHFNLALRDALIGKHHGLDGEIRLQGRSVQPRSVDQAIRMGIGIIEYDALAYGLAPNLDYVDNIGLMVLDKLTTRGVLSRRGKRFLRQIYGPALPPEAANVNVSKLDVHAQNRVLLIKWQLAAPPVLICVNPSAMTDVISKTMIFQTMDACAKAGSGVLLLASDPEDAKAGSDRILVYAKGCLTDADEAGADLTAWYE